MSRLDASDEKEKKDRLPDTRQTMGGIVLKIIEVGRCALCAIPFFEILKFLPMKECKKNLVKKWILLKYLQLLNYFLLIHDILEKRLESQITQLRETTLQLPSGIIPS